MASSSSGPGELTNQQIVSLGSAIPARNMKSIALKYLDIDEVTLRNIEDAHRDDLEGFNREVIRKWAYKTSNSGPDQVKRLASLLYQAAQEGSYIAPSSVEEILGIPFGRTRRDTTNLDAKENVKESDVLKLGRNLGRNTEHTMKIDMAHFASSNKPMDIEKLFIKPDLAKMVELPTGQCEVERLDDYKEVFSQGKKQKTSLKKWARNICSNEIKKISGQVRKGLKVLVKGAPGNGKTTFAKKIVWDWTRGILKAFYLVFFVSMKLVRPGDAIENVIIQQNPTLEGLHVTQERLSSILDDFGERCLIIFDGFDEHDNKTNEDIMRLLRGQKFLHCNVLITSRPHNTTEIAKYFQTVLQIRGFTKQSASELASRMLIDQTKVNEVLEIKYENYSQNGELLFTSPMLLTFVCILTNNKSIDLSKKAVTLGETYDRLIRCLYRKYTSVRGKEFKEDEFFDVVKRVGKLAHDRLKYSSFSCRKSDLFASLGEDAFEYGFIIGHEDLRLAGDDSEGVVVEFLHRTIQEFLAAFYFVATGSIASEVPMFMTYPLVLQFCLWFASDMCYKQYFPSEKRQHVYQSMVAHAVTKIDAFRVNLPLALTRVLNLHDEINEKLLFNFLQEVLSQCTTIRYLRLCYSSGIDWLLKLVRPLLKQIFLLRLSESLPDFDKRIDNRLLSADVLHIHTDGKELPQIYEYFRDLKKPFVLEKFNDNIVVKLSDGKLHIATLQSKPIASLGSPLSRSVQHLSLLGGRVNDRVVHDIISARQKNECPNLTTLELTASGFKGKLSQLFPEGADSVLRLLVLDRHLLDAKDITTLSKAPRLFPNLNSLELCDKSADKSHQKIADFRPIFQSPWLHLTDLKLFSLNKEEYEQFIAQLNSVNCPKLREIAISLWKPVEDTDLSEPVNIKALTHLTLHRFISRQKHLHMVTQSKILTQLHKLDISHSSGITGTLSILLCHLFTLLKTLTMSNCGLNSNDLTSLAQAKTKGRLPDLRHLDVSQNDGVVGKLDQLFADGAEWELLETLNVQQHVRKVSGVDLKAVVAHSRDLKSLTNLLIATNSVKMMSKGHWAKLQTLDIWTGHMYSHTIYWDIADAVVAVSLPVLQTVHLSTFKHYEIFSHLERVFASEISKFDELDESEDLVPLTPVNIVEMGREAGAVQFQTEINKLLGVEQTSQVLPEALSSEEQARIMLEALTSVFQSKSRNALSQKKRSELMETSMAIQGKPVAGRKLTSETDNLSSENPMVEFMREIELPTPKDFVEDLVQFMSGAFENTLVPRKHFIEALKAYFNHNLKINDPKSDAFGQMGTVGERIPSVGQNSPGFLRLWRLGVQVL